MALFKQQAVRGMGVAWMHTLRSLYPCWGPDLPPSVIPASKHFLSRHEGQFFRRSLSMVQSFLLAHRYFCFPASKSDHCFSHLERKGRFIQSTNVFKKFSSALTFCSSLEENLAAATGEGTIMAAGGLVGTDQAHPLRWEEELHGVRGLSARLKSAARYTG